jgi:CubicO group peptidase (beta-lactamase class C family)
VATIHGLCDERFDRVRVAFERNFDELGDVGASVAVHLDGRPVVDLWGGVADPATGREWQHDTPALVFSTTKGLTAICALLLWERGELDIDAPVADVWSEFAAAGKRAVTTRLLLSHQAGLAAFDEAITVEQCHQPGFAAERLAAQAPSWEPGRAHGYHALTYGWLVGEIVRRVSGRSVGQFLAEEIAGPLGLDMWIGLPPELGPRVAVLQPMRLDMLGSLEIDERTASLVAALFDAGTLTHRVFFNPALDLNGDVFNSAALHQAEWPAAGGITTARALAGLYGELACDRVLRRETLDAATERIVDDADRVLIVRSSFGLGVALPSDVARFGPTGNGFGHDGAGGSVGFADRRAGIGFGYVMNQMGMSLGVDRRVDGLVRAVYTALGES